MCSRSKEFIAFKMKLSLVLLPAIFCVSSANAALPLLRVGPYTYHYEKTAMTWLEANKFCRNHDLQLICLSSAEKNTIIGEGLIKQGLEHKQSFHTGGTNLGSTNGTWYWQNTFEDVNPFIWHIGEPNNRRNAEHVIVGMNLNGVVRWNDDNLFNKYYFVCEEYDSYVITPV